MTLESEIGLIFTNVVGENLTLVKFHTSNQQRHFSYRMLCRQNLDFLNYQ
ncbi:hypothetical protein [Okeania sp. SIO2B3]|nr:hypothetical protein [Okeania sp. SIO2B3]NET43179.1 hypothetical protein [Okeania sp. SIO2B3]